MREPTITMRELRRELDTIAGWCMGHKHDMGDFSFREGQQDGFELVRELIIKPREQASRSARRRAPRKTVRKP